MLRHTPSRQYKYYLCLRIYVHSIPTYTSHAVVKDNQGILLITLFLFLVLCAF
ncbi:hypothetical protein BDV26DRAFT_120345 [Aspergillus bertholletiae]|uniref:Uncharacterized protein n=1 Tax=Aspergillus bertholletiae TaxID=1226010 RepID=A0A5N7BGD9_9EURO|nr:hypothetical protein BDV26DRAFT_120345 [Aspergillus bertholletiae]